MNSADFDRLFARVHDASRAFRRRWTLAALRKVDEELFLRMEEQRMLYEKAQITGDPDELEAQTAAMCRGWTAATSRMEQAGAEPDAYLEGFDSATGCRIRISDQMEVSDLCKADGAIFVTPDEVATIISSLDALRQIKSIYPGAVIEKIRDAESV